MGVSTVKSVICLEFHVGASSDNLDNLQIR